MTKAEAISNGKTKESPFTMGKAIEFVIEGVSLDKVYSDIVTKKIPVNYGTITKKPESIEISLPHGGLKKHRY